MMFTNSNRSVMSPQLIFTSPAVSGLQKIENKVVGGFALCVGLYCSFKELRYMIKKNEWINSVIEHVKDMKIDYDSFSVFLTDDRLKKIYSNGTSLLIEVQNNRKDSVVSVYGKMIENGIQHGQEISENIHLSQQFQTSYQKNSSSIFGHWNLLFSGFAGSDKYPGVIFRGTKYFFSPKEKKWSLNFQSVDDFYETLKRTNVKEIDKLQNCKHCSEYKMTEHVPNKLYMVGKICKQTIDNDSVYVLNCEMMGDSDEIVDKMVRSEEYVFRWEFLFFMAMSFTGLYLIRTK